MRFSGRTCQNSTCRKRFESKRSDARFCSDRCRYEDWDAKHPRVDAGSRTTDTTHPLAGARAEQEASDLNSKLGQIVYQAIVHQLETKGRVHADDLEPHFPAEHLKRCRKLTGGQFGSLAGRAYIVGVEYRKSTVPERKGAKSWVYVFTDLGRSKLVGVGGPKSASSAQGAEPGVQLVGTADPSESEQLFPGYEIPAEAA